MLIFLFASNSDENEWCADTGMENATNREAANKTPCIFLMVESLRFASASLVGPLFNSLENNVSRTLRVTIITHLKQQFHQMGRASCRESMEVADEWRIIKS